jgi:hypothetical protein
MPYTGGSDLRIGRQVYAEGRIKEVQARSEQLGLKLAALRAELVPLAEIERLFPIVFTELARVVGESASDQKSKKRILEVIADWPRLLESLKQRNVKPNGELVPAAEPTVPKRRGPGRPRKKVPTS